MNNYIGIDLGTTNSVISTYDGNNTRIWKSPEQNDVTPSVIYLDKRSKYYGKRAYDNEPLNPNNAAKLFKRFMGSSTSIEFSALGITKSPEECSAEILKVLLGYLPEELRNSKDTKTVITVPSAFSLQAKQATREAARIAGINNVALMQEPVAAVMSVMKYVNTEGNFIIYDLGGGTLDISIAKSSSKNVSLLSQGGISMCGGRDFDREIVNNIVKPWLEKKFNLPKDYLNNSKYKSIIRLSELAVERAKIELSSNEEAKINLDENEVRLNDENDNEIYLDINLDRDTLNKLISSQINESIASIIETLEKAGITPKDVEKIIFIGGPTNYKPLRDKVASKLGIPGCIDINPMTAVAEGASIYAEGIDWQTNDRSRKKSDSQIINTGEIDIRFRYTSRTPNSYSRLRIELNDDDKNVKGGEYQIDNIDTGWSSGRRTLENGSSLELELSRTGPNNFKAYIFNQDGRPINLKNNRIEITKTIATIQGIPASHSIAIEVKDNISGGQSSNSLDYIIKAGDALPKKKKVTYKSAEALKAGSSKSLKFKIWEGEIAHPISDNRFVGFLEIKGTQFDEGYVPIGADLECEFKVLDSGNIQIEVDIPCLGSSFKSSENLYSWQEGEVVNYNSAPELIKDKATETEKRINDIRTVISNENIEIAQSNLKSILAKNYDFEDIEQKKKDLETIQNAKKVISKARRTNLKEIRQIDLRIAIDYYTNSGKRYASESEIESMNNLIKTLEYSIESNFSRDFEYYLDQLYIRNFYILWEEDWFVLERFTFMENSPHLFFDRAKYRELIREGNELKQANKINQLRNVVSKLYQIKIWDQDDKQTLTSNIVKG